jgi:hypothetical protein
VYRPSARNASNGASPRGDIPILQLLLAAEIIETDLWQQYREFGGVEAMGGPSQGYITALEQLDGDMPQYISDNTDDEISHVAFLRAYLKSKGQRPINLDTFRIEEERDNYNEILCTTFRVDV